MSNLFAKVVAKVIAGGAAAAGRALVQAYHQALKNAEVRRAAGGTAAEAMSSAFVSHKRVPLDEARKILHVPDNATAEQIEERYLKVFDNNSPDKGSSFYLQSKAFRAREALLQHMQSGDQDPPSSSAAAADGEKPEAPADPKK